MTRAFELIGGFVPTSAMMTMLTVLSGCELGRMVSRDDPVFEVDLPSDGRLLRDHAR